MALNLGMAFGAVSGGAAWLTQRQAAVQAASDVPRTTPGALTGLAACLSGAAAAALSHVEDSSMGFSLIYSWPQF